MTNRINHNVRPLAHVISGDWTMHAVLRAHMCPPNHDLSEPNGFPPRKFPYKLERTRPFCIHLKGNNSDGEVRWAFPARTSRLHDGPVTIYVHESKAFAWEAAPSCRKMLPRVSPVTGNG